jgi:TolA-binding protein
MIAGRPRRRVAPNLCAGARRTAAAGWLFVSVLLAGCQSVTSPLAQWRAAYDGNLFKRLSPEEAADVGGSPADSTNLLQRWLTPRRNPAAGPSDSPSSTLILGSNGWRPIVKPAPNPQADAEFQAAIKLFRQGEFAEAEKQFARIAKKRKGTNWGQDGQYYLAECQFQRKKYVDAHDSFERLHADYPGATEYLPKLIEREYAIAQMWFGQSDSATPPEKKLSWTGHFDGSLPLIDTQGSALKALEHVRHNDPTGPLADRASVQIADYYMKRADYESAALYYDQFIAEYRKSPFLQRAQLAAIDARMKGYLGPEYDGSGLEKARDLVKRTMQTFPERQASFEKLYQTLDHINEAQAEKTFRDGMYYKRAGKVASAEYYLGKIPQRWPSSPWAVKAKAELAQLAKLPRKPSKPSKIIIPPGGTDPNFSAGPMGGMGMGGMGMGGMGGMGMGGMGMPGGMM